MANEKNDQKYLLLPETTVKKVLDFLGTLPANQSMSTILLVNQTARPVEIQKQEKVETPAEKPEDKPKEGAKDEAE